MTNKRVIVAIASVAIMSTLFLSNIYLYASDDGAEIKEFVRIQCETAELADAVGNSSVLPEVYASVETRKLLDVDDIDAENDAKNELLIREATYRYAVNNGFALSEEKIDAKFKDLINFIQETEEYSEIQSYYVENGQTFEDNIYDNYKFYETEFVISEMYSFHQNRFANGEASFENYDYNTWEEYWDALQRTALQEYKSSKDYAVLDNAIDQSLDIIESGEVEEISDMHMTVNESEEIDGTMVYDMLTYDHVGAI